MWFNSDGRKECKNFMCNESFTPTRKLKNFCSPECRVEFRREYKRIHGNERYKLKVIDKYEERKCLFCGVDFHPKHGNQKYCTSGCRMKANLIQQDLSAQKLGYNTRKELRIAKWTTCPECGGRLFLYMRELVWMCGNCSYSKKDRYKHTANNLKILKRIL